MARSARNSKLENRTQRLKLKESHRPYWLNIGQGLYMGYRKGLKGSSWIARFYIDKKYITQKLGKADDYQDANNLDVLDFFQAQAKARDFAEKKIQNLNNTSNTNVTIGEILNNYLEWFKTHRKSFKTTKQTIDAHILPFFASTPVNSITTKMIRNWHENLAKQPPRLRSTSIKQSYADEDNSPEAIRRRKATANRILTILKSSLNQAWRDGYITNNEEWSKVRPFRGVDAPKIRYLELSECQLLINACEPDFRKLVRAGLLTGCRYGELIRLRANDFNSSLASIFVRETKNGKPRHVPLTEEGMNFFNELTAGLLGNQLIFERDDGVAWGISHQSRRLKVACSNAKIEPAISFHVLRHTYGSLLASRGVPLQVIAELLGHADTRITSRHYAHLMPSFVSDTLRANLPEFTKDKEQKIHKFSVKQLAKTSQA